MGKLRISKEEVIAEYLSGDFTFRELGSKYNIPYRSICGWVLEHQGRKISWREKMKRRREKQSVKAEPESSKEIKLLRQEVRKQLLRNELLEEIIRIGGMETGIDWKKKFGTKQS